MRRDGNPRPVPLVPRTPAGRERRPATSHDRGARMRERGQAAAWALLTCWTAYAVAGCGSDASARPVSPATLPAVVMSPTPLPTPTTHSGPGVREEKATPGPGYLTTLTAARARGLLSMPWHQLAPLARGEGLEASVSGLGGCVGLRGARLTTRKGVTEVALLATRPKRGEICATESVTALVRVRIPDSAFATRIVHAPVDAGQ